MEYKSIVAVVFFGVSSLAALAADPNYPQSQSGDDRMKGNSEANQQQPAGAETDHATGTKQNSTRETPDAAYSAELKKCDSMQGNDRKNCITAAKKKAGQM